MERPTQNSTRWAMRTLAVPATRQVPTQEELDFIDPAIRSLIEQALRSGAPDFVAGFETDDGTPLEAAWTGPRVAVVPHSGVAAPTGWIVRSVDEWTLNELLSTIQERN